MDSRGSEPPLLSVNNFVTMDISLYFLFYPFLPDLINPSSSLTGGNIQSCSSIATSAMVLWGYPEWQWEIILFGWEDLDGREAP